MSFASAKNAHILLDSVAGSLVNLSGLFDTISWPQSVQTLEVSAFGTTAKAFVPGLTDGDTITLSGPFDTALGTFVGALKAAQAAGSASSTINYSPFGSVASAFKITAETYVSAFGPSTGVGGRVEASVSLQVTGVVTNTTW